MKRSNLRLLTECRTLSPFSAHEYRFRLWVDGRWPFRVDTVSIAKECNVLPYKVDGSEAIEHRKTDWSAIPVAHLLKQYQRRVVGKGEKGEKGE
jgi:hypothetical protein